MIESLRYQIYQGITFLAPSVAHLEALTLTFRRASVTALNCRFFHIVHGISTFNYKPTVCRGFRFCTRALPSPSFPAGWAPRGLPPHPLRATTLPSMPIAPSATAPSCSCFADEIACGPITGDGRTLVFKTLDQTAIYGSITTRLIYRS